VSAVAVSTLVQSSLQLLNDLKVIIVIISPMLLMQMAAAACFAPTASLAQ
jgi:hypothetical protein